MPPPLPEQAVPLIVPTAAQGFSNAWQESFVVPYGLGKRELGTAKGGEGGGLRIGPEYGAPAADGTWWFLDVAKQRLAHYSEQGTYLGATEVPPRLLIDGRYFQWALPHALADGTLIATRLDTSGSALLRLRNGELDEIDLASIFTPSYDDGTTLFGTTIDGQPIAVDPTTGAERPSPRYLTPSGSPFSLTVDYDNATTKIVTDRTTLTLNTTSASGAPAHVGVQIRAGADESLHLLLFGTADDDPQTQLVGYLRINPDGTTEHIEPLDNPFSMADPGSPGQLVIAPGSTEPNLVYVLPDGVHIYKPRSAAHDQPE